MVRHGYARAGHLHPLYMTWSMMKQRCGNPKFPKFADYGARGIEVYEPWRKNFATFLADVGERPSPQHTLDRIDNDGHYAPGNVRWATRAEQQANRRTPILVLEYAGETKTLREWAAHFGLKYRTLFERFRRGTLSPEEILAPTPARVYAGVSNSDICDLLRSSRGLETADVAKILGMKPSSTYQRLQGLKRLGRARFEYIEGRGGRGGGGGRLSIWFAT